MTNYSWPPLALAAASGGATEAKQDTQITLATSANTKLDTLIAKDFATSAKQDTGNTSLSSIDTKLSSQATAANQTSQSTLLGAVTETAPASDTASSGLNGRLQRVAQRITSLIALVPASLGQKASASAFAVTLSSEQEAEIGIVTETAPASDTASSGLNGRLQRIAQRLTSLIALVPASLGQKASASSLAVTLSSEQEAELGIITETAPASDTASSGLNGRLQRIAQRLTSLIALQPASLGQKAMSASFAVVIASDQSALSINSTRATVAGTVTNAQAAVGTSAVRATVSGSAPNAARKRLSIKPSTANTGRIFLGSSSVTTANGLEIVGPDRLDFEFDSGDYYLISDTAAQVVEIVEKA